MQVGQGGRGRAALCALRRRPRLCTGLPDGLPLPHPRLGGGGVAPALAATWEPRVRQLDGRGEAAGARFNTVKNTTEVIMKIIEKILSKSYNNFINKSAVSFL